MNTSDSMRAEANDAELDAAEGVAFDGEIGDGIAALRAYTRAYPRDPRGFVELAGALQFHDVSEARRAVTEALRLYPADPEALCRRASIDIEQARPADALETLIELGGRLPPPSDRPTEDALRGQVSYLTWDALDALGRHEEALETARQRFTETGGRDMRRSIHRSLVALGRLVEAEVTSCPVPGHRLRGIDGVASDLDELGRMEAAIPLLSRALAYCALPDTDFRMLNGYLEGLYHSGNREEVMNVTEYWLARKTVRRADHRRRLVLLRSMVIEWESGVAAALALMEEHRGSRTLARAYRRAAFDNYFEKTDDLVWPFLERIVEYAKSASTTPAHKPGEQEPGAEDEPPSVT